MDFSKFTNDNFDAKDWINEVFQGSDAQANKEQYASNLVVKLQLLIQEVAKSLEDTSQQIVLSMPRIKREIHVMQQEAVQLQGKMKAVERDVQKVEQDTSTAMDGLLLIDLAKSRMVEVEKALKEVDNWTAFTRDIEEIFATGNPDAISDRLIGMQQSLNVLGSKVHDFKDRSDYLDRLKDQFVAAVSPSVVASLTSTSPEMAQYFAKMFASLERTAEFENYCRKVVKADIGKQWTECLNNEELNGEIQILLNAFYDSLLSFWFAKLKWFSTFLKNAPLVLCAAFAHGLATLEPNVQSTIVGRLDASSDKIAVLIAAKCSTENVARSVESFLNGADACRQFCDEFFKPYAFFVENYQQYEQSFLLAKLNQWNFENSTWSSLGRVSKSADAVFAEAFEALTRCQTFTNGFGLPGLVKAYKVYFDNYLSGLKRFLDAVQNAKSLETDENWDRFENTLKLLEVFGSIFLNLSKLDEGIDVSLQILKQNSFISDDLSINYEKDESDVHLSSFDRVILTNTPIKNALRKFLTLSEDLSGSQSIRFLRETRKQFESFDKRISRLANDVLLGPIKAMTNPISKNSCWSSTSMGEALAADLPSFGLAPQEYITKIGQYLMTFAHHMEPYLTQEDVSLRIAMSIADSSNAVDSNEQVVRVWLECAGDGLMRFFVDSVSNIKELSPSGSKQLIADIEYLCNVLEDLGIAPTENLSTLSNLLKLSNDELRSSSTAEKFNSKLLSVVKEMKKVK